MNSGKNNQPHVALNQEEVAACAYLAWEKAGRPKGRDLDFWLEAEMQLRVTRQQAEVLQRTEPAILSVPKRSRTGGVRRASRPGNAPIPSVLTIGTGR